MNQEAIQTPFANEDLFNLIQARQGGKITIIGFNMLGLPFAWQATVYNCTMRQFAQYSNSVLIGFIPKGKRKPTGYRVNSRNDGGCIIFDGWLNPDVNPFPCKTEYGSQISLPSFSDQYMVTALKSIPQQPIFNNTGITA